MQVSARRIVRHGFLLATVACSSMALADPLVDGFREPPASARPRVWWHWMNGNITEDGIVKDLEWMKRAGIGGVQAFDASVQTPQIVEKRLAYMTPEWKAAFGTAAATARRLDLELAIASAPGWSETGGPWVKPEDAMKKLAWSETTLTGGKRFAGRLPTPPSTTGAFQDLPYKEALNIFGAAEFTPPTAYRDVAVLAYPVTDDGAVPVPRSITAGDVALDVAALTDTSLTTASVPIAKTMDAKPTTLLVDYGVPRTFRSLSYFIPQATATLASASSLTPLLEASDDKATWSKVADVVPGSVRTTIGFPATTARYFRLTLTPTAAPPNATVGFSFPAGVNFAALGQIAALMSQDPKITVAELRLSPDARINQAEAKAGFYVAPDYHALDAAGLPDDAGTDPSKVVDLTSRMRADGSLDWTPPAGRWRVVRLGWSLLGTINHPATHEATGLEVDKLDGDAVRRYAKTYLGMYKDAAGSEAGAIGALLNDSTEVGAFNWTPQMVAQFRRLRGYDPTPWLPALTGAIVGSRVASDRFLYDYRRTIADLHASEHYGTIADIAHAHGLKLYGEALENGRPSLGDDVAMRRHTDVPMAALWTFPDRKASADPARYDAMLAAFQARFRGDMKGASSVAHLYGQNIAAAESFTSILQPWNQGPAELRRVADYGFVNGINRPVVHTSPHQPVDGKFPGLSLGVFGQFFDRHESWAEMARPWTDYLARSSYLLQQGRDVADVAYFYGEDAPLTQLNAAAFLPDVSKSYAFDFVNADALTGLLKVDGGDLVAPSGARYRLLQLGGSSGRMTLPVLRRIAELTEAGATVLGDAPTASPSMADDPAAFRALVARLWSGQAVTAVGKGRVIAGRKVEAALAGIGAAPDFFAQAGADVLFVHRKLDDGELYFLDNNSARAVQGQARFRVTGKAPELWHADTGRIEPLSYRIENGVTIVPLDIAGEESAFVVFRRAAAGTSATVAKPVLAPVTRIDGPWSVAFQPNRGAPAGTTLPALASLSEQAEPGIKYFSGIATYTKRFDLPRTVRKGAPLWLDLGAVGDIAEVKINGRAVGSVWHAPYRLDIGQAAKAGANTLEVRVANLWVNRLVGDAQPGATKITWTSFQPYQPKAPLRPSGLIGPVGIAQER